VLTRTAAENHPDAQSLRHGPNNRA
jgi:hypothetical protein